VAKILIVEDTIFIRSKIKDAVFEGGHVVVGEAENGVQAVNLYPILHPDIVTLDITMPIMSGIEALKQIIKINPEAKVIMLSAMGQQMIVIDCIKLGAKHFIVKPFSTNSLLRVIDEVLENVPQKPKAIVPVEINPLISEFKAIDVHNITGTFVIEFPNPFNRKSIEDLLLFVEEVLNVNPLNIVIDFKNIEFITYQDIKVIDNIISTVRNTGGKVVIYSQNTKFIAYLHSMKVTQFNNIKNDY